MGQALQKHQKLFSKQCLRCSQQNEQTTSCWLMSLCRKFNKAVSTKHLKIENYSVILQKEFVYYGKQAACFAGCQYH